MMEQKISTIPREDPKLLRRTAVKTGALLLSIRLFHHHLTILRKMLLNKRPKSNRVMVNPRKDCLKLIRIKKLKINSESMFEIQLILKSNIGFCISMTVISVRYVQYFTPNQILPLFTESKAKMQTRVQLIDAKDSRGIKLGKIESFKLLELALKAQGSQFEFIVMPPMTEEETKKILENLKHSTTLAYGKTSHKVTRQHLRNNTLVDASDIVVPEDSKHSPIAKGLKILTRMFRKQQKIVINELYNNMACLNLESNERKLKIQLFLSKLNSVVTKKIDMVKYSCFNEIKLSSLQNRSINRTGKEYEQCFSNSSRGYNKERIERKGTDSELRRTRSTNRHGYGYSSPSHTNASNSMNPIREAMAKNGICKYPLTSSLIGNTLLRQHLGMTKKIKEKEEELSDSMLISDSLKDNDYELSSDSDIETKELDDYINRRLAKIEETKAKKEKSKLSRKEESKQPKSKEKIVIFDDSEYEYVLESEEDEEEYSSSEDNTQLDQIFTKSFLAENMRASDALLIAKNSLVAPNEVSRLSSNLQRSRLGPMRSTVTRKSEVKNNGSILQVEERKEDSYIHPAFENSVAFSNISGIFGHQTLNNHGLMSLRDDSFANEYEDLEFESNLEKELNCNSEKKSRHARIPSAVDTVSEDEYGNTHKDSHIVYLKTDMEKITKDLERIRDLVMNNPNAKQAFDCIFEESQSKSKIEKKIKLDEDEESENGLSDNIEEADSSDYELQDYDSRAISDFIHDRVSSKLKNKSKK